MDARGARTVFAGLRFDVEDIDDRRAKATTLRGARLLASFLWMSFLKPPAPTPKRYLGPGLHRTEPPTDNLMVCFLETCAAIGVGHCIEPCWASKSVVERPGRSMFAMDMALH